MPEIQTPRQQRAAIAVEKQQVRERIEAEQRAIQEALGQSTRKKRSGFKMYGTYESERLEQMLSFAIDAIEAANGEVDGLQVVRTHGTADFVAWVHFTIPTEAYDHVQRTLAMVGLLKQL